MQGAGAGGENCAQEGAMSVLQLPGGGMLLILGSLILLAVGSLQLIKAARASYLKHLDARVAPALGQIVGYATRGLVFLITGFFLIRAGLDEQASEAGGMADALAWLNSPWDVICCSRLSRLWLVQPDRGTIPNSP